MNLLLICETPIIEQIFSLVCKKLNLQLIINDSIKVEDKYDFIVVDHSFIDDDFNILKQSCKKLSAICSEELPFDKSRDFIVPRPFLPTKLQELLEEQIQIIKEESLKEASDFNRTILTNEENFQEDEDVTVPITDYVESLAEDVYLDIEEDNDESIVSLASLRNGGILDNDELTKINDILKEDDIRDEINYQEEDWKDIVTIIDDALTEVREYEFPLDEKIANDEKIKAYEVILSKYSISELKPFLTKLNQEIIDKLSSGESVNLKLKLKENSD